MSQNILHVFRGYVANALFLNYQLRIQGDTWLSGDNFSRNHRCSIAAFLQKLRPLIRSGENRSEEGLQRVRGKSLEALPDEVHLFLAEDVRRTPPTQLAVAVELEEPPPSI